jgi:hypothetical protein
LNSHHALLFPVTLQPSGAEAGKLGVKGLSRDTQGELSPPKQNQNSNKREEEEEEKQQVVPLDHTLLHPYFTLKN